MDLQPITVGNDKKSFYRSNENIDDEGLTWGADSIIILGSGSYSRLVQIKKNPSPRQIFSEEKKYFDQLIKKKDFLEKNKKKYIAIKNSEIIAINSNFSTLSREVFKDNTNIGKVFISLVTEHEAVTHFDSPLY